MAIVSSYTIIAKMTIAVALPSITGALLAIIPQARDLVGSGYEDASDSVTRRREITSEIAKRGTNKED